MLVCSPLDPNEFNSPEDLMNRAHEVTRDVIAPDQTETLTRKEWFARMKRLDYSV